MVPMLHLCLAAVYFCVFANPSLAQTKDVTANLIVDLQKDKTRVHAITLTKQISEDRLTVTLEADDPLRGPSSFRRMSSKDKQFLFLKFIQDILKNKKIILPGDYSILSHCERDYIVACLNLSQHFIEQAKPEELYLLTKYDLFTLCLEGAPGKYKTIVSLIARLKTVSKNHIDDLLATVHPAACPTLAQSFGVQNENDLQLLIQLSTTEIDKIIKIIIEKIPKR